MHGLFDGRAVSVDLDAHPDADVQRPKEPEVRRDSGLRREYVTRRARESDEDPIDGAESEVDEPALLERCRRRIVRCGELDA